MNKKLWLAFAVLLVGAPWVFPSNFGLTLLAQAATLAIITLSFNLLFGQTGLLSFGHAVFVGLGAYVAAHGLNAVAAGTFWLPVSLMPLAGGLGGALSAALLGVLVARQSGTGFAMITLALGEMVAAAALMFPAFFGGEAGIRTNRVVGDDWFGISYASPLAVYGLIAVWLYISALAMFALTRTPLGKLANALRDNPARLACIGFDPARVRWAMLVFAGFFAGIGGALAVINFEIVNADSIGTVRSGTILLFTVLGGTAHFFGPVIGALAAALSMALLAELTRAWLFYLGLVFLAVTLVARGGLAGVISAHARALHDGSWRRLLRPWLRVCAAGLPTVLAGSLLIELSYRLRLDGGQALQLGGIAVSPHTLWPWLLAVPVLGLGGLALRRAVRQLRRAREGRS